MYVCIWVGGGGAMQIFSDLAAFQTSTHSLNESKALLNPVQQFMSQKSSHNFCVTQTFFKHSAILTQALLKCNHTKLQVKSFHISYSFLYIEENSVLNKPFDIV